MIDFGDIRSSEDDEVYQTEKLKLDIGTVLENIDTANFDYYSTLNENEKKLFTPYTVQRWVGGLDDSIQLTYNAKSLEAVFGKWTTTGKKALNELIDEFNKDSVKCSAVSKYEHANFDWRIKFSVSSQQVADELHSMVREFVPSASPKIVSLISSDVAKNNIQMLNSLVNVNFWELNKYPELVYKLLCLVSVLSDTTKKTHTWIPMGKSNKKSDSEIFKVLQDSLSELSGKQFNMQEYKILVLNTSKEDFERMLSAKGYQDNERKALMKKFKSEKEKYAK